MSFVVVRIGIVSNGGTECDSCDSRIGFGTGGRPDNLNTCGNKAGVSPDNGQMGTNTSKPWDTSWYNKYNSLFQSNSHYKDFSCFKPNP